MTKSITIVNTSNWEHEDVLLKSRGKDIMLKPGESVAIGYEGQSEFAVDFVDLNAQTDSKDKKPLYADSVPREQLIPQVFVAFECERTKQKKWM